MDNEIIKMQEIISELGYSQIKLENEYLVELLLFNSIKEKNIIFVVSYNKSVPDRYPNVGNIAIEHNRKPDSGFFTIIREVNKENVITALSIVEESVPLGGTYFVNYHKDVDKVIKEYASLYDFNYKVTEVKGDVNNETRRNNSKPDKQHKFCL